MIMRKIKMVKFHQRLLKFYLLLINKKREIQKESKRFKKGRKKIQNMKKLKRLLMKDLRSKKYLIYLYQPSSKPLNPNFAKETGSGIPHLSPSSFKTPPQWMMWSSPT